MNVAVIGIGQSLRGDDAAGLEAVHRWQEQYPETARRPEVRVETSELPGLGLLDLLEGADGAVLVDAIQSSALPGTIHYISAKELSAFTPDTQSAHGWGVAETLSLARTLNMPIRHTALRIVGIEAEQMNTGQGLSASVEEALPEACTAIEREVQALLH